MPDGVSHDRRHFILVARTKAINIQPRAYSICRMRAIHWGHFTLNSTAIMADMNVIVERGLKSGEGERAP